MTPKCLEDVTSSPALQASERHIHLTTLSYPRWSWFPLPHMTQMSCSNVEERWYSCSFKMLLPLTRGMICNLCPNHRRWQGHGTSLKGCSTQFSFANRFVVGSDILLFYRCPWPCDNRLYNEDVVTRNVLVRLQPLEFVRSLWSNVCTMWAPSVSWLQRQEISKCRRE